MNFLKSKLFIFGILAIILIAIGLYFYNNQEIALVTSSQQTQNQSQDPDKIRLVSTKPEGLLEGTKIILPTQEIEITFSHPLENRDEMRRKLSPEVEYDINLINDKKTAVIKPKIAYPAGTEFSLIIQGNSKFDGKRELGDEYILHFKTIEHKGI